MNTWVEDYTYMRTCFLNKQNIDRVIFDIGNGIGDSNEVWTLMNNGDIEFVWSRYGYSLYALVRVIVGNKH